MQREWKYLSFSDGDTRNIQKPESLKSSFTRRQTLKRKEPSAEERTIYDQLLQDTSEEIADFSCLSMLIVLRLLDLWLPEFVPVEPQRAHTTDPALRATSGAAGGGPAGCVHSGESGWRKERSKCIFTFFTVNVSHHIFCILYWFYM